MSVLLVQGRGLVGRVGPPLRDAAIVFGIIAVVVLVRGYTIGDWERVNPDEAELLAQARAVMRSPLPFSDWTMGTTGPVWPFALAALGLAGVPLTLAFAHLLAAVTVGGIVATVFVLARRSLGTLRAALVAGTGGLAFALIFPLGGVTDFGGLATELLPVLLVLLAALIPARGPRGIPVTLAIAGLLVGLAVGAKYQVLPLGVAVLVVRLVLDGGPPRRVVAAAATWSAGAVLPFALLAVLVALSPTTDPELLAQQVHFLTGYAGGVPLPQRLGQTVLLLLRQPLLYLALAALVRAWSLSAPRVRVARAVYALSGLAAVFAGGMAFGHYLIVLYAALALALALPVRAGARFVPSPTWRRILTIGGAVLAVAALALGAALGRVVPTSPSTLGAALSPESRVVDPELADACPPGSSAVVWGWSPELYVHYGWNNGIPMFTSLGTATDPATRERVGRYLERALDDVDCVVDAVGPPYFVGPESAIPALYPALTPILDSEFIVLPALDCASCTVYVRRDRSSVSSSRDAGRRNEKYRWPT